MKKEKMITRTIESTKYTVMCVNPEENTCYDTEVTFSGSREDSSAISALNETFKSNNSNHIAIMVKSAETIETLYGMPESFFMAYAVVLPPRGTKKETEEE